MSWRSGAECKSLPPSLSGWKDCSAWKRGVRKVEYVVGVSAITSPPPPPDRGMSVSGLGTQGTPITAPPFGCCGKFVKVVTVTVSYRLTKTLVFNQGTWISTPLRDGKELAIKRVDNCKGVSALDQVNLQPSDRGTRT